MAVKFDINTETGEAGMRELRQTVDELHSLLVTCDQTKETVNSLDKTMGLNKPAGLLVDNCKAAIQAVLPVLEDALVPIEEFVKNMAAAEEAIAGSTAGNLDLS